MSDEEKKKITVKSEESMRTFLREKSWPEKVRSIERMNAADKIAKKAMKETLARLAAEKEGT